MSGFCYYLLTFAESLTAVVGIRSVYEQPHYVVVQDLGRNTEIRRYDPRVAIEATIEGKSRDRAASEAFGLLFRYITGANAGSARIAMTAPVQTESQRIAMTAPVQTGTDASGTLSMRFFLPNSVAKAGAPQPTDPRLHLVDVPAETVAVLRYSGVDNAGARAEKKAELLAVLAKSPWKPAGEVFTLNYDPPFTIPFLRRNEAAVDVTK
nr:heme-binding protein [uncultured Rhodopila sp.]